LIHAFIWWIFDYYLIMFYNKEFQLSQIFFHLFKVVLHTIWRTSLSLIFQKWLPIAIIIFLVLIWLFFHLTFSILFLIALNKLGNFNHSSSLHYFSEWNTLRYILLIIKYTFWAFFQYVLIVTCWPITSPVEGSFTVKLYGMIYASSFFNIEASTLLVAA